MNSSGFVKESWSDIIGRQNLKTFEDAVTILSGYSIDWDTYVEKSDSTGDSIYTFYGDSEEPVAVYDEGIMTLTIYQEAKPAYSALDPYILSNSPNSTNIEDWVDWLIKSHEGDLEEAMDHAIKMYEKYNACGDMGISEKWGKIVDYINSKLENIDKVFV